MLTPEERAAIEQKIADLAIKMRALDHLNNSGNVPEWAALYAAREALDQQLGSPIDPRD